jgi:CRISPR/Cas system-associated exonuclease Cas4 (RecB family)
LEQWPDKETLDSWLFLEFEAHTTPKGLRSASGVDGEGDGVVRWRSVDDRKLMFNLVRDIVVGTQPHLERDVFPYRYDMALRFRTPAVVPYLDGKPTTIQLAGEMDVLVLMSGENEPYRWHGIDLKGTRDDSYINKTLGQAIFYDLALLSMFGPEGIGKWSFLQPMCKNPMVPITVSAEDHRAMMARIARMATYIWQKDWSPREDTKECGRCEVKSACIKYQPHFDQNGKKRLSFTR